MATSLRIVIAQLNFQVGNLAENAAKHIAAAHTACEQYHADIIVFPELSLTGYPPEDLLLRRAFMQEVDKQFKKLLADIKQIYCFFGHPLSIGRDLFNTYSAIYNGNILCQFKKNCLPNYGVFDEARYFTQGQSDILSIQQIPITCLICEDLWRLEPIHQVEKKGARLIISPNASPFEMDKYEQRLAVLEKRTKQHSIPIVYVNLIGGQDELIFDGGSCVMDAQHRLIVPPTFFRETLIPVDFQFDDHTVQISTTQTPTAVPTQIERTYQALVLALKDYLDKNHFKGVLIGVSGGIDSALTLAIAVDALGADRVRAVLMPSRYTSDMSLEDGKHLCDNFQVSYDVISIESAYQSFLTTLHFEKEEDITQQNIQARIRAVILMALSNQFGYLVLTTGNRSELAVGYCTLYGDMAGGFAILKDVPKTFVYELAHYRNQRDFKQKGKLIPERILERAPTAELAFNQKDEDSLPPYPILDNILHGYLDQGLSKKEIVEKGFDQNIVEQVIYLVQKNEYKRYQSALGPHLHHKSFGKDWRYPITNGFKE